MTVLHPDIIPHAERALAGDVSPNRLSSALLVRWRELVLILGSDVLAVDWRDIAGEFANLERHAALKVPHHASREAQHDSFAKGGRRRLWIATPFNRGRKLPRFEDGQGVEWLLRRVDELQLTALPVAHRVQGRVPFRTTRQNLAAGRRPEIVRRALGAGLAMAQLPGAGSDFQCYVAAAFSADGQLRSLEHGAGAVVVGEAPPGRHATSTRTRAARSEEQAARQEG